MKEQLREESSWHVSQLLQFERQVSELDKRKTELRIEMVELELEKTTKLEESEKKYKELQDSFTQWQMVTNESQNNWEVQLQQHKDELEEVRKANLLTQCVVF